MPLNFSDIALSSDEWEALLAVRNSAVLIERHNQVDFDRLVHHGFVEIISAYGLTSSENLKGKGMGVTKPAAVITDLGKDFVAWMLSRIPPQEPHKNPIGFSPDSD